MSEPFGPFRTDCDPVERIAQLRCLRTLVHVYAPTQTPVIAFLRAAETDDNELAVACGGFDMLPALTRRRILATFAHLHHPRYTRAGSTPEEATNGIVDR